MSKLLKEQGHGVYGVDRKFKTNPYLDVFFCGDAADKDMIAQAVNFGIDAVFHFAADVDVHESTTAPAKYFNNNVGTTAALLENLCERQQWRGHFIFSSTAAVYGNLNCAIDEQIWPGPEPVNPYGQSKWIAEQIVETVFSTHQLKTTVFRYFNVAGAWNEAGDHFDSSHIVSRLCRAARHNEGFVLYGSDYNTPDGTCIRDYLHVLDVCRAHLHAIHNQHGMQAVYNLGTGRGASNLEMIENFNKYNDVAVKHRVSSRRDGDPPFLVANGRRFVEETGFTYKHSCLHEILTSAWQHYQKGTYNGV